jgi:hypothetical protein
MIMDAKRGLAVKAVESSEGRPYRTCDPTRVQKYKSQEQKVLSTSLVPALARPPV